MTNSIFASKLIKVFFATSKGRFRCTYIAISVNVFFRNQLLVFLRICFYWAHLFHLMKLITCFSCASNRSRKWCVTHFYHCIWRYFQIPSCKNYVWAPKGQNQRVPLLYYARLHEDPIPPSSTSSLSRARLLGSEISISLLLLPFQLSPTQSTHTSVATITSM